MTLGSHALHTDVVKKVGGRLFFNLPASSTSESRVVRTFRADSGDSFQENSVIRIRLPQLVGTFLNGAASRVIGTVKCTGNGVRWASNVQMFIQDLSVYGPGNEVIDNIQNYNVLQAIISDLTVSQDVRETVLSIEQGYGTDEDRKKFAVEYDFSFALNSSFLKNYNLLPLETGPFTIELKLARRDEALITDSGEGYYAWGNVAMQCKLLTFPPVIEKSVLNVLAANKMNFHAPLWATHYHTTQAQTTLFSIPNTMRSAKTVLLFMRNVSDLNNFQSDPTKRTKSFLDRVDVQIGKMQLEQMTRESQFWSSLKRAFHEQITGIITYKTFGKRFQGDGSAFLIALDLEKDDSDSFISGEDSKAPIKVKITHSQQPTEQIQYQAFFLFDRIVEVRPSGVNVVS